MHCKEFAEELAAYLEGESAVLIRVEIEEHMRKCRKCRVVVETCQATILIYRYEEAPELPAMFHRRMMEAVHRTGGRSGNPKTSA